MTTVLLAALALTNALWMQSLKVIFMSLTLICAPIVEHVRMYVQLRLSILNNLGSTEYDKPGFCRVFLFILFLSILNKCIGVIFPNFACNYC